MSRVLIVEDEEAIADLEKDYLELSGFTVEIENNGTAGLKRALSEEFDMFILDLMLPGTDGFEICKKIREEKNTWAAVGGRASSAWPSARSFVVLGVRPLSRVSPEVRPHPLGWNRAGGGHPGR